MGSAAKFGLLVLMALVIALARFLEGEVKPRTEPPVISVTEPKPERPASPQATPAAPQGGAASQETAFARPGEPAPEPEAEAASGQSYTVRGGDTLGKISKRFYGSSHKWQPILEANRSVLKSPKHLKPGMTLTIPKQG